MSMLNFVKSLENDSRECESDDEFIGSLGVKTNNSFLIPRICEPKDFLKNCAKDGINIKFEKGTTTLSFVYQGGIIVAVDSRATAGNYIASQSVKKIIEINKYMIGTMAGGAADCLFWERYLSKECRLFELKNGRRITISAASKILSNIMGSYKNMGLSMGTMVCGVDHFGPSIYYIEDQGTRLKSNMFSVGSGSTYAYGILDSLYNFNLTFDDAVELGKQAIYHATYRDAMSGGVVNVYHIDGEGWKNIGQYNVADLHEIYGNQFFNNFQ